MRFARNPGFGGLRITVIGGEDKRSLFFLLLMELKKYYANRGAWCARPASGDSAGHSA